MDISIAFGKRKHTLSDILVYISIIELILGGAGHVIGIGALGIRLFILAAIFLYEIYLLFGDKLTFEKPNRILIYVLAIFIIGLVHGIMDNPGNALNEFVGYTPFFLSPFYIYYFQHRGNIKKVQNVVLNSSFILAILQLLLWSYCLLHGQGAYISTQSLLDRYNYGFLAYIGPIPRLFFKTAIFISVGLFITFADLLQSGISKKRIIGCIIFGLSILTSFTVGIYAFTALGLFLIFLLSNKKISYDKLFKYIILVIILMIILLFKFNVLKVLSARFSGDYTMGYKGTQGIEILRKFIKNPILGYGLGYPIVINYGYQLLDSYSFEIMWLQLLLHLGIIGFGVYVSHIIATLKQLYTKFKTALKDNNTYLIFFVSVIFICLDSFTNPYMNNAIGILFYDLAVGVAYSKSKSEVS